MSNVRRMQYHVQHIGYNMDMAKNGPKGKGRQGVIRNRSQVFSGRNKRFTKIDNQTGRFIDQMTHRGKPFKGTRIK